MDKAKCAFGLAISTVLLLLLKSTVFTIWFTHLLIDYPECRTLSNELVFAASVVGLMMMGVICYFQAQPRARTSTFNLLFVFFNAVMILNTITLMVACYNYDQTKPNSQALRWYIGVETFTVTSCGWAYCIWVSASKDGFKRYVAPVKPLAPNNYE